MSRLFLRCCCLQHTSQTPMRLGRPLESEQTRMRTLPASWRISGGEFHPVVAATSLAERHLEVGVLTTLLRRSRLATITCRFEGRETPALFISGSIPVSLMTI